MSHEFKDSIKSGIKYCVHCGCLSYKNVPSKTISITNYNIFKMDPLILKYRPISLKINPTSIYHANYIAHRKIGLLKIYEISKKFDLIKTITFKAIGLMDKIYLNDENDIPIEYIEKISLICILLSFQFNNYFIRKNNKESNFERNKNNSIINGLHIHKNLILECYQFIKAEIKELKYWQILCLKNLCFNLCEYTAFDYINLFFKLGIIFTEENVEIYNYYNKCINMLEIIINNNKICNYSQYVVALSVIYLNINREKNFSPSIFKYIYGVDFSKKKYLFCINDIKGMINELYHLYFNKYIINNRIINSGFKPTYFPIIKIIFQNNKSVNFGLKKLFQFNNFNN